MTPQRDSKQHRRRALSWLRWRGAPRLAFAVSAALCTAIVMVPNEAMYRRQPRREALVFPSVSAPPRPQPVQLASNPIPATLPVPPPKPVRQPVTSAPVQPAAPVPVHRTGTVTTGPVEAPQPPSPEPPKAEPPQPQPQPRQVAPVKPAPPRPVAPVPEPPAPRRAEPPVNVPPARPPEPKPTPPREYACDVTQMVPVSARGLTRGDFQIEGESPDVTWEVVRVDYEQNVEHRVVETKPLSLTLLFDQSGSITTTDPHDDRIPGAQRMLELLPAGTRTAVVHFQSLPALFGGGLRFDIKTDQEFTTDAAPIRSAIEGLRGREKGFTPLYTALSRAVNLLATEQDPRERILICFSDGLPQNDRPDIDADKVVARAKAANVRICFLALGAENWSLLETIAKETGGSVVSIQDSSKLGEGFASLARSVITVDHSAYRVKLRAHRKNQPFTRGERLAGTVHVNGQSQPFSVNPGEQ